MRDEQEVLGAGVLDRYLDRRGPGGPFVEGREQRGEVAGGEGHAVRQRRQLRAAGPGRCGAAERRGEAIHPLREVRLRAVEPQLPGALRLLLDAQRSRGVAQGADRVTPLVEPCGDPQLGAPALLDRGAQVPVEADLPVEQGAQQVALAVRGDAQVAQPAERTAQEAERPPQRGAGRRRLQAGAPVHGVPARVDLLETGEVAVEGIGRRGFVFHRAPRAQGSGTGRPVTSAMTRR